LYALQPSIPELTRSSLHRCLQRHEISRLPDGLDKKPTSKRFKSYPIGYFHMDIVGVQTAEGKLYMLVAIDRTSKFAFAQLHPNATKLIAAQFLRELVENVPYTLHTVLTDNGITFTNRSHDRHAGEHLFDKVCREHQSEHRLTQVKHPWTNEQVARMNRTIKEATVKRFHYDDYPQLQRHLADFINAYSYAQRLKALSPFQFIQNQLTNSPQLFKTIINHQSTGYNS